MRKLVVICYLLLCAFAAQSQQCTTLGQTPSTAFPVCGTNNFKQTSVPICENKALPVPGCGNGYSDKNPFWYKFTCFQSGTLGFLITPANLGDDYDWQLYDITDKDPNEVYTNTALIVTGNWAGTYGPTGASASGVGFIQCGSDPAANKNSFAQMPNLIQGHTYLLMVSHFTNTQSGYTLSFNGGTAVITDSKIPRLGTAETNCGGDVVRIKLNKKIKCNSIATNGSDFTLNATGTTIVSAKGINCNTGFDSDSIELQLSGFLAPGTYRIGIKPGSDGNTLLDVCDNALPTTDELSITIVPKQPTLLDSIAPVSCAPKQIRLIFKKPINCSSISSDGSDFSITGTYAAAITSVVTNCATGFSRELILTLDKPLQQAGTFTIRTKLGADGNTIIDECGEVTPVGSGISFSVKDTVNADFTYRINYGCSIDTVNYFHPGGNGISSWRWNLDEAKQSTAQNPQALYTVFNEKNVQLIVSNGFCSDTTSQKVTLLNYLKADFTVLEDLCPDEPVTFTGKPVGKVISHHWSFGDGGTAGIQNPVYTYAVPGRQQVYRVEYSVTDSFGCVNKVQKPVTLYTSCYLAVPSGFTPNGDGKNDFLYPLNAVKAENLEFRIFNRWGQLIFATKNWKRGWDGTFKGQPQPSSTYVWTLRYTDRDTGQTFERKGTVVLIR